MPSVFSQAIAAKLKGVHLRDTPSPLLRAVLTSAAAGESGSEERRPPWPPGLSLPWRVTYSISTA